MPPPPGKLIYLSDHHPPPPLRKKSGSSHDSMAFYRDKGTEEGGMMSKEVHYPYLKF